MYSSRTKLSLAQYLELQEPYIVAVLFEKHGTGGSGVGHASRVLPAIVAALHSAEEDRVTNLLMELARTQGDLRNRVSPRYRYDERLRDLKACLMLDGYLLDDGQLEQVCRDSGYPPPALCTPDELMGDTGA